MPGLWTTSVKKIGCPSGTCHSPPELYNSWVKLKVYRNILVRQGKTAVLTESYQFFLSFSVKGINVNKYL